MKQPASSFGRALRYARRARGLPQEEFDAVSSRTYISTIERGLKQPTIAKVDALAGVLGLHPLTLLALSYCSRHSPLEIRRLLDQVRAEIEGLDR